MRTPEINIKLNNTKITAALCTIVAGLTILHLIHLYLFYEHGLYLKQIDLNMEENLPTLYASLALLSCSFYLFIIAHENWKTQTRFRYSWLFLGVIFVFLAYDEYYQVHDPLSKIIRNKIDVAHAFFFAWVIPYSVLSLLFVIAYLRFWLNLASKYKALFFISGFIYILGTLGFEMLGAPYGVMYGRANKMYAFLTTIEELFEMIGIVLFHYTLLGYIVEYHIEWKIKVNRISISIAN